MAAARNTPLHITVRSWGSPSLGGVLYLAIRPDEVRFTILVQINFYMASHTEEIRSLFVSHEGKRVIVVEDISWYRAHLRFKYEIQTSVETYWFGNELCQTF
jgi:hypothetical protein